MHSGRILAVIDDDMVLNLIYQVLSSAGYQVTKVSSAAKAFLILSSENFTLVITDLRLGGDDAAGFTVLRRTKELNPLIMVIITSGNPSATPPIEAFRRGANDYLLKPFTVGELTARVDKCMATQNHQGRPTSPTPRPAYEHKQTLLMLTTMAHDTRESLVSMASSIKLLQKGVYGKLAANVDSILTQLASRCEKLHLMSEEYLQQIFSLETSDTRELEVLELQKDVIAPVLDEFADDILDSGITVELINKTTSSQKTVIHASKVWLKAAVRNIVNNAIKYGGKGSTIGLFLGKMNSYYLINISNSHSIIPKSRQHRLFKMPERPCQKSGQANGVGIGLYLTKKIIQQHGGMIWYDTIENKSHFFFTLPIPDG